MYDVNESKYRSKDNIRSHGEVYTPINIVDEMLDKLPPFIWTDTSVIYFEPTCGNGNFLVQIALKLLNLGISVYDIADKLIGFDILDANILDCKTRLSKILNIPIDSFNKIHKVDDSLQLINDKTSYLYEVIDQKKVVVVGNPPFAKPHSDTGNVYDTIYNIFVESIINNINPEYFTFITPSRWMIGGKGLDDYRNYMMNLRTIKEIHHFGGLSKVFPDVVIPGGVSYFLIDKNHNGTCEIYSDGTMRERYLDEYDIIVIDNNAIDILNKILPLKSSVAYLCQSISIFGLPTNFSNYSTTGLKCLCKGDKYSTKAYKYVDCKYVKDKPKIVHKWKICTATVNGGARNEANYGTKRVFGDIIILAPYEVSTYTYIVVAHFDTEPEAINYVKYMKTKFYRFVLGIRALSPILNKEKFIWVPDMGSYTVEYTDEFLYQKYNLTKEECGYIESKIEII